MYVRVFAGGIRGGGQEKGTGVIASVLAADNGYWV